MTIETKYSKGDKVFLIDNNKIKHATVVEIYICCKKNREPQVEYRCEIEYENSWSRPEDSLFKTREELIETL